MLSRQAFAVRFRLAVIVAAAALLVPASASASGVTVSDLDNGAAGNLSAPSDTASATPQASSVVCDKVISPGQSVSAVVNSLAPGQTGCLHGGTYTEGTIVTWRASGTSTAPVTVTEYPGEKAEIVGTTFNLGGSYQVMRDLTVRDVTCTDCDGITVDGTGNRVEHNEVYNVWRQGILLHTDASNAAITRNYVHDTGQAGSNQYHGIYVQGDGHVITNNLFANMHGGYGIHVYPSSSNVVVAQNTVVNSETRSGILIDTTGGNIVVVNNIVVGNTDYGVLNRQCSLGGCVVDHNLAWNNGLGATSDSATNAIQADPLFIDGAYHVASDSPAVNAARSDYSYSPALDGISRPQGGAPDIGAYEHHGLMTPSLVGSAGAAVLGAAGASVSPAYGTGETPRVGNLVVCWLVGGNANATPSAPAASSIGTNWLLATSGAPASHAGVSAVYYKIADGSDAVTIPAQANTMWAAMVAEFTGVPSSTTVDQTGSSTTTPGSPLVVTTGDVDAGLGELVITSFAGINGSAVNYVDRLVNTFNNDGWSSLATNASTSTWVHYSFGYAVTTSASAADSDSVTFDSASGNGYGSVVSFKTPLVPVITPG